MGGAERSSAAAPLICRPTSGNARPPNSPRRAHAPVAGGSPPPRKPDGPCQPPCAALKHSKRWRRRGKRRRCRRRHGGRFRQVSTSARRRNRAGCASAKVASTGRAGFLWRLTGALGDDAGQVVAVRCRELAVGEAAADQLGGLAVEGRVVARCAAHQPLAEIVDVAAHCLGRDLRHAARGRSRLRRPCRPDRWRRRTAPTSAPWPRPRSPCAPSRTSISSTLAPGAGRRRRPAR